MTIKSVLQEKAAYEQQAVQSSLNSSNSSNSYPLKGAKDAAEAAEGKALNVSDPAGSKIEVNGNGDRDKPLLEDTNVKAFETGSGKDVAGSGKDGNNKLPIEDQLAANSASSTASRHGGSVYDIIVQVNLPKNESVTVDLIFSQ